MKTIELDTKILNKNLEITRALADNTILRSQLVDLKERMKSPIMLQTLEKCSDALKQSPGVYLNSEDLRKDLRKVISFLQQ